jgi:hypothetical protein
MAVVSTDDDYTPSVQMLDELKQRNQNKLKPTLKSVIIDATILPDKIVKKFIYATILLEW